MARYAIGDIQGCYEQFSKLLALIGFNPGVDVLYLVGDLVNRGPQSLQVLQWIYEHQDSVITVLGNHDIYLLARYCGVVAAASDDTLHDLLDYYKAKKLINYLRTSALILQDNDYIVVHAGIYPKIGVNQLFHISHAIANRLRSKSFDVFLQQMFNATKVSQWSATLSELDQMKFVINACTRMRYLQVTQNYALDFKYSSTNKPDELIPWFQVEPCDTIYRTIVFGHWASLGLWHTDQHIALDSGCVWGRKLTAINLENHQIYQV